MTSRRDYGGRYQKQPTYAGKNLRLGKIKPNEVEMFAKVKMMAGRTRNRLQEPIPSLAEYFVQCWRCLSVMHLIDDNDDGLSCKYCGAAVEVLTKEGIPV